MAIRRGIPPLLVLTFLLTGCTGDEPPKVQLAQVGRASVSEVVEAPGTVGARATAALTSPAAGTVDKLYVSDGDTVEKGQLLARIDSPAAKDQLDQAREADRQASARPATAPASVRLPRLRLPAALDAEVRHCFAKARKAARKIEDRTVREHLLTALDAAQAQHKAQQRALSEIVNGLNTSVQQVSGQLGAGLGGLTASMSSLQAASRTQTKAAVKAARSTVKALTIKAPFDGVVTLGGGSSGGQPNLGALLPAGLSAGLSAPASTGRSSGAIAVGVPVAAGDTLLTVTDISELTLAADVDETDVLLVKDGTSAVVEFDAVPGGSYAAEVTGIGVTPKEGATGGVSYPVRLTLGPGRYDDGTEAPAPKPGMSAVIRLTVREAVDVVAVPTSAIVTSGRENVVWVDNEGRAQRRTVKLGAQGDTMVEVLSGLSVGDRIVVRGADTVRDGQELA
ncbi:efflux RND transporter periplasmic adaptor subunit [Acrocarpospora catenulata]|uniref:efflux RND transporter periplasmic adaptor subunit n=1 Tax=Acrocarpospora catenulata TaxID=2836182 RepID=UPI001BDA8C7D|nr:efflux RND transporter periplasmic adaptor subunit [Acrocarpospora catenulata]